MKKIIICLLALSSASAFADSMQVLGTPKAVKHSITLTEERINKLATQLESSGNSYIDSGLGSLNATTLSGCNNQLKMPSNECYISIYTGCMDLSVLTAFVTSNLDGTFDNDKMPKAQKAACFRKAYANLVAKTSKLPEVEVLTFELLP